MIKLEILDSNDADLIGVYNYQFDSIYIGRSSKADLIFNDKEMPAKFLTIKFVQNNLVIQSEPDTPFYFVNGKKLSGLRRLNPNDIIQFGTHKIKLLAAQSTNNNDEDLALYFDKFNKEAPELKFVLEFLENEIIEIESKNEGLKNV